MRITYRLTVTPEQALTVCSAALNEFERIVCLRQHTKWVELDADQLIVVKYEIEAMLEGKPPEHRYELWRQTMFEKPTYKELPLERRQREALVVGIVIALSVSNEPIPE